MADPLGVKPSFDTTDFKNGIRQMNDALRVLDSGFKASAAALGDWGSSTDGLNLRVKTLGQSIDIQKQKVAALAAEHQRLVTAQGADSHAAQQAEINFNKATESLNKMQKELSDTEKSLNELSTAEKKTGDNAAESGREIATMGKAADTAGKQSNTFKNILGGLGAALKATVAVAAAAAAAIGLIAGALIGMAASTIKPASDLNETISKVGVVFGEAAPVVVAFGEQAATSLGMSENAALAAAGTYGNLFRAIGLSSDKSADMSVNLVKLAGDLASFNNIPVDVALEKLRAGLTGEAEPLKSLGINLNEATLKAKAMEMGLSDGKGTLDASAKAQAAYAIMLEQSALAQGDFARTSGGLANQQRIFAAQLENTKAQIGTAFLPIVTQAMVAINGLFNSAPVQAGISAIIDGIGQLGQVIQPVLDAVKNFDGDFGKIATAASGVITQLVTGLAAQAPKLIQGGLGIVKTLMDAILPALPALMESGAQMLVTLIKGLVAALPTLVKAGMVLITTLIKALAEATPELARMFATVIPEIAQVLIDNLPLLLTVAGQLIFALIQALFTSWQTNWPSIPAMIAQRVTELWPMLQSWLTTLGQQLSDGFNAMFGKSLAAFGDWLASLGESLAAGFGNLVTIIQTIGLVLLGLVLILLDGILSLFGTNLSQLSTAVQAGWNNLVRVVSTAAQSILANLTTWGGQVITVTSKAWNDVVTSVQTALASILTALSDALTPITDAMSAIWASIVESANGVIDQFFTIGANIIAGIGAGIQSGVDSLGQIIQDVIDAAVAKAKAALGIQSPSKLFAAEVGIQIPAGIGEGITNAMPALTRKLNLALGGLTLSPALSANPGAVGAGRNYTDNSNTYYGAVYNVYRSGESGPQKAKRF